MRGQRGRQLIRIVRPRVARLRTLPRHLRQCRRIKPAKHRLAQCGLAILRGRRRQLLLQQQSPLLRKFDVANKKTSKAQVVTQYSPTDAVNLSLTGSYALADYDSSPLGLQADERYLVGTDTSWQMNDPQNPKSKWWLPNMDFIGFRVAQSVETDTKK